MHLRSPSLQYKPVALVVLKAENIQHADGVARVVVPAGLRMHKVVLVPKTAIESQREMKEKARA